MHMGRKDDAREAVRILLPRLPFVPASSAAPSSLQSREPPRSRTKKTLASKGPEQRRLGGRSHGGRRLRRRHGVRSLPPPSPFSRARFV
jgi:hypothetical protein